VALISDGSRICDLNRVALVGIDVSWVDTFSPSVPIIYCGGLYASGAAHTLTSVFWHWRRVGGTFQQVAAAGEIIFGAGTVLVDGTIVNNAAKRTNQTATSSQLLRAYEGTAGDALGAEFASNEGAETQIALSLMGAIPGMTYEMRLVVNDGGTVNIDYAAKILVPERQKLYYLFPPRRRT
jgi:hypothetical protein